MASGCTERLNLSEYFCPNLFVPGVTVCKLSHTNDYTAIDVRRIACRFFFAGSCRYEESCMFAHISKIEAQNKSEQAESVSHQYLPLHDSRREFSATCEFCDEKFPANLLMTHYDNCERKAVIFQRSLDVTCGICKEIVKENVDDPRFGILPNCKHSFCYGCIRTWRNQGRPSSNSSHIDQSGRLNETENIQERSNARTAISRFDSARVSLIVLMTRFIRRPHGSYHSIVHQLTPVSPVTYLFQYLSPIVNQLNNLNQQSDIALQDEYEIRADPVLTRSCPICRIKSRFTIASDYWVEDDEEKSKFMRHSLQKLRERNCKYFVRGGKCKYRTWCHFLHAAVYSYNVFGVQKCIPLSNESFSCSLS